MEGAGWNTAWCEPPSDNKGHGEDRRQGARVAPAERLQRVPGEFLRRPRRAHRHVLLVHRGLVGLTGQGRRHVGQGRLPAVVPTDRLAPFRRCRRLPAGVLDAPVPSDTFAALGSPGGAVRVPLHGIALQRPVCAVGTNHGRRRRHVPDVAVQQPGHHVDNRRDGPATAAAAPFSARTAAATTAATAAAVAFGHTAAASSPGRPAPAIGAPRSVDGARVAHGEVDPAHVDEAHRRAQPQGKAKPVPVADV